jgi:MbtH protein
VANPFESEDQSYFALVNNEGQFSLWPQFAEVPAGWEVVCGPDTREACLGHVNEHWTDMRPKSLVAAMNATGSAA